MRDRELRLRRVTTRMTVRQRVAALLAAGRDGTVLPDDIGRGLTPAGWAAFRRDCARLDQLHATVRDCLARAKSAITACQTVASMFATARLAVVLGEQLEDALDYWSPRRGPGGAADRDLDGEVRTIAGVLRRAEEDLRDAGAGTPCSATASSTRTTSCARWRSRSPRSPRTSPPIRSTPPCTPRRIAAMRTSRTSSMGSRWTRPSR